jgi:nicotinamidase-related amidase
VKCHKPITGYQRFVSDTASLVVDMLNNYRHEDADKLATSVADILDPLAGLVSTARERDAHIRHFQAIVPPDAFAHIDADLGKAALRMMECNMAAEPTPTSKCLG